MTEPEYKQYRRSQTAELADWTPGFDMTDVSISFPDKQSGSPKERDKIARNPGQAQGSVAGLRCVFRGQLRACLNGLIDITAQMSTKIDRWCGHPEWPAQYAVKWVPSGGVVYEQLPKPGPAKVAGCEHTWNCPLCGWGAGCAPDPCNKPY